VSIFAGTALVVAAYAAVHHAAGRGFIVPREGHRGSFQFELHKNGDNVRGSLQYKDQTRERTLAEIRLPEIRRAAFTPHVAEFGGQGSFNGHRVNIQCRVSDGGEKGEDTFAITARTHEGRVAYEGRGIVREGNIVIRHEE
jgi:hypothetical protein